MSERKVAKLERERERLWNLVNKAEAALTETDEKLRAERERVRQMQQEIERLQAIISSYEQTTERGSA